MDIIAEILETDRLAEEKLAEAERKRSAMLENPRREQERLSRLADENSGEYAAALKKEYDSRLDTELAALKEQENKSIAALEEIFGRSSDRWAEEIFARCISLDGK